MEWLKGKKTYLVAGIGILVNGALAMGYIDERTAASVDGILIFLGFGAMRAGIAKIGK